MNLAHHAHWNLSTLRRRGSDRHADQRIAVMGLGNAWEIVYARLNVMGWATGHIANLQAGKTVSFRPRGNSMSPRIESGQLCTVEPVEPSALKPGDIVLCKVRGTEYLHFVKAIQDSRFQIGNNRGHINGWIGANSIFGRLLKIEP